MAGAHLSSYLSLTPVGQWPSPEGFVRADVFLLIDSVGFLALLNLFLILLASPAPFPHQGLPFSALKSLSP